jgi:hypothetical protein
MPTTANPAPTWIWLELTEEQRSAVRERTGREAAVLYLSLEELAGGGEDGHVQLTAEELEQRIAPAITRN